MLFSFDIIFFINVDVVVESDLRTVNGLIGSGWINKKQKRKWFSNSVVFPCSFINWCCVMPLLLLTSPLILNTPNELEFSPISNALRAAFLTASISIVYEFQSYSFFCTHLRKDITWHFISMYNNKRCVGFNHIDAIPLNNTHQATEVTVVR